MTDFSQLDSLLTRITTFTEAAIPCAAKVVKENILDRTASGKDAENKTFTKWGKGHTYSPAQEARRKALGLQTSKKDIRETGGTLDSLELRNESGRAAPKSGTELATDNAHMPIMVGQMQHPGWRFHHNVMGMNDRDVKDIDRELTRLGKEIVRGDA